MSIVRWRSWIGMKWKDCFVSRRPVHKARQSWVGTMREMAMAVVAATIHWTESRRRRAQRWVTLNDFILEAEWIDIDILFLVDCSVGWQTQSQHQYFPEAISNVEWRNHSVDSQWWSRWHRCGKVAWPFENSTGTRRIGYDQIVRWRQITTRQCREIPHAAHSSVKVSSEI